MTTNLIDEEHRATENTGVGVLVLIMVTAVTFVGMCFVPTSRTDTAAGLLSDFLIFALLVCAVDALVTVRAKGREPDRDAELNRRFGRIAFVGGIVASGCALVLNFVSVIGVNEPWRACFWRIAVALAASVAVLVLAILIELVVRATAAPKAVVAATAERIETPVEESQQ